VRRALEQIVDNADFGYPNWGGASPMRSIFVDRMATRYGWEVDPHRVREVCDVVQAVQIALFLATQPGDGVVLHMPAYHPFLSSIESMRRARVEIEAHRTQDGWEFDYDGVDKQIAKARARALVLCHPHNPTGHVFGVDELHRVAELAARHDLVVISDEIHADLVYGPARHVPFAIVARETGARCVTVTSASKAFNLAGLRWAAAVVDDDQTFEPLTSYPGHLFGAANLMGVSAAAAAWTEGDAWLTEVITLLDRNRHLVADLLASLLPEVGYVVPDATYLAWLDCRPLGLDAEPVEVFRAGGVELSPGADFGAPGFVRLNFATDRATCTAIVESMARAVGRH
jgi:cystathionine beta-lyase